MSREREYAIDLVSRLSEAHGAPGHEDPVRRIFADELKDYGTLTTDRTGSIACTRNRADDDGGTTAPTVLVAGHLDEVGFLVQNITPDGFIQFVPLGGWWSHTLLSQRMRIRTRDGREVVGITTSVPVHFLPPDARNSVLPIERMFIDVGASSAADVSARVGIRLGDPIVPDSNFTPLADPDRFLGKALDNRVGTALAIHLVRRLGERPLPCTLVAAGTTQEEVGTRGAQTLARLVRPDLAIVLEAPPADDSPGFNPMESQGAIGRGVQVRLFDPTAIMNRRLADFFLDLAADLGIPCQAAVRRSGGTDAKVFHLSEAGVPTVVVGVPCRYIHTHAAVFDINDYLAALDLVSAALPRLDGQTVTGFASFLHP